MDYSIRKIYYSVLQENPGVVAVSCINILTLISYFFYKQRQTNNGWYRDKGISAAIKFIDFQSTNSLNRFIAMYHNLIKKLLGNNKNIDIDEQCLIIKSYMTPNLFNGFIRDFKFISKDNIIYRNPGNDFLFEVCLINRYKIGEFYEKSFILTTEISKSYISKEHDVVVNPGFYTLDLECFNICNIISSDLLREKILKRISDQLQSEESSYKILYNRTMIRDFRQCNKIIDFKTWVNSYRNN